METTSPNTKPERAALLEATLPKRAARRAQAGRKSSDDIERDIARARHEMDGTFGEIRHRLRPERLRWQAERERAELHREQNGGERAEAQHISSDS